MIDRDILARIKKDTETYWQATVRTPAFEERASGKEIGHRIADYVDEQTTSLLEAAFETAHELNRQGGARPRSMGDVWIQSQGMYNPINIKAGEAGKNGQPNMVSLTKLLDALMAWQIDSYYLLIVKMRIPGLPASADFNEVLVKKVGIVPNVYLVDMLDYLDFLTFDSGPGQVMLKEKNFYEFCDGSADPPQLSITEKVGRLIELFEDGDRRLIENRSRKLGRIRRDFAKYSMSVTDVVRQGGLDLG